MAQHAFFAYRRDDAAAINQLVVSAGPSGPRVPKTFLSSFLEHLGFSTSTGVTAEILLNPTFHREHNLNPRQLDELATNGQLLVKLYLSGNDARVLKPGWTYMPVQTGFGMALLDNTPGLPLAWSPLGSPGSAGASLGQLGGAVRLQGGDWPTEPERRWPVLEDGPAGVRQGVWLPVKRCLGYHGSLWVRIGANDPQAWGEVEIGIRRRVATPDGRKHAGESLASVRLQVRGEDWLELPYQLLLEDGQVSFGEPVDFYIRWLSRSNKALPLLIDRAELYPDDAVHGIDPEVIQLSKDWPVPMLRWPGGNFVSYHHWRDGVGPAHLRPTDANYAWGGLDYNLFGTDEFIQFCRLIDADPQITVNAGTATAEEAAAWVEYCNGGVTTPMGRLRAENGHPEPYNVRIWEVGNENFGFWQGGYQGSDENARRFALFSKAMRAASPIPIQLIACGNFFDFSIPGPGYDHTHADRRWHDQLLKQAPDQIDYISLHSLPSNELFLEAVTEEEAHNALLAQVTTFERHFLPELLAKCDNAARDPQRPPIGLAITEWGVLGRHPGRQMVENFGGVVYVGAFLNMMIRNAGRIPIANTTGFMHGGCIRKAYGTIFVDPQYTAVHQFARFIDSAPVPVSLVGPGFDVDRPADIGAVEKDVPFIDAVACRPADGKGLLLSVTNKHMTNAQTVEIEIPGYTLPEQVNGEFMAYPDLAARTDPVQPERFPVRHRTVTTRANKLTVTLEPFSVCWLWV